MDGEVLRLLLSGIVQVEPGVFVSGLAKGKRKRAPSNGLLSWTQVKAVMGGSCSKNP